jgi:hypothetical protein
MGSIELQVGELKGTVEAIQKDVTEMKKDLKALVAQDNRRKGGWAVVAIVAGFFASLFTRIIA